MLDTAYISNTHASLALNPGMLFLFAARDCSEPTPYPKSRCMHGRPGDTPGDTPLAKEE